MPGGLQNQEKNKRNAEILMALAKTSPLNRNIKPPSMSWKFKQAQMLVGKTLFPKAPILSQDQTQSRKPYGYNNGSPQPVVLFVSLGIVF